MTTTSVTTSTTSGAFTETSGNTLLVLAGGIVSAATIDSGGALVVSSGGEDFAAIVLAGATETISAHGSAAGDFIYGTATVATATGTIGGETVENGGLLITNGIDSATTISAGGTEEVSGGTATGDQIYGTLIADGPNGTSVTSATIYDGGQLDLFNHSAVGTTVDSGGTLLISGNNTAINTVLSGGGMLELDSPKANISGSLIFAGGGNTLDTAAVASAGFGDLATISGFSSTDKVDVTALGGGATLSFTTSGTNEAVTVGAGGTSETFIFSGTTTYTSATLFIAANTGQTLDLEYNSGLSIISNGTSSGISVTSASPLLVEAGATVISTTVQNGGTEILSGGVDSAATISAGGAEAVQTGSATGDQIYGAVWTVSGGSGVFANETVQSGGTFNLANNNAATGTTVLCGGLFLISGNNGPVTSTTLSGGGTLELGSPAANISGSLIFAGGHNTLEVTKGSNAGDGDQAVISGFSSTDAIDATFISATSATLSFSPSGSVTSVTVSGTGGSETFIFSGAAYNSFTLSVTSDGSGYAELVYNPNITVGGGQTFSGITLDSGQTLTVQSGGTVSATTVEAGATEVVSGVEVSATIWSGGTEIVYGAAANDQISGSVTISGAGASVSSETIDSGGTLTIGSGALDSGSIVLAGGSETVLGSASGDIIYAGAQLIGSGGTAFGAMVSGGDLIVLSGGLADPATIYSGGTEIVSAGGTDLGAQISGGVQNVFGTASGATIYTGSQVIEATGIASNTTVSGGLEIISAGGTDLGAQISGGVQEVYGSGSGATVFTGSQVIESGGSAVATSVSGGQLIVLSGGQDFGAVILSGGTETVSGHGSATGDFIYGTVLTISGSTGVFANETVESGGTLDLLNANTATDTTVLSGGLLFISGNNGPVTSTTLSGGGTAELDSPSANISGPLTFAGGDNLLDIAKLTTGAGASAAVISGFSNTDRIEATVVGTGATLSFGSSGVNEVVTISGSLGSETFLFSGTTTYTNSTLAVVSSGGQEYIEYSASGFSFSSGGSTTTSVTTSTASGVYIESSSNTLLVLNGGIVSAATISSGAFLTISSGGEDFAAVILSGGVETVTNGGSATGDQISGAATVASGAIVASEIVYGGATLTIDNGAVESAATILSGATETVSNGGSASFDKIYGTLAVITGGLTATVSNATIYSGGELTISQKAAVSDVMLISGGTADLLTAAATLSGTLTFSGGGNTLIVTSPPTSGATEGDQAVILGFSSTDKIDVTALGAGATLSFGGSGGNEDVTASAGANHETFIFSGTSTYTSSTLAVVSSGGHEYIEYSASGFSSSSGGITTSVTTSTAPGAYTESSGNTLLVLSGGIVSAAIISGGAFLTISSGGEDFATIILLGGVQTVASAGSATGDQIYGGATVNAGASVVSETVDGGGVLTADTGAFVSATIISAGGTESVQAGSASNDQIYGTVLTVSGDAGVFAGETVESGGTFNLANSNSATSTTVLNGGLFLISGSNGPVTSTVLSGGGTLELDSPKANISGSLTFEGGGNTLRDTAESDAGYGDQAVISGFSSTDTIDLTFISATGATLSFSPGSSVTAVTLSGTGGSETFIFSGEDYDSFTLSVTSDGSGHAELVYNPSVTTLTVGSGTTSTGISFGSGQTLIIQSGGTVSATIVEAGGTEVVSGVDVAATIWSGGIETVYGAATKDQIYGSVNVSGVSANVTSESVNSGGVLTIDSGAVGSATTILLGGTEKVSAGSATGDNIFGVLSTIGGAAGTLTNETVHGGGTIDLYAANTATGTTVSSGGTLIISGAGSATNTVLSGGAIDLVTSDATLSGSLTFISGGNTLEVTAIASAGAGEQAVISGFSITDKIDVTVISATGATLAFATSGGNEIATISGTSGGVAVTESFVFSGTTSYDTLTLSLMSDGSGGVDLVYAPVPLTVSSGAISTGLVVGDGETLVVQSGGTVSSTTVESGGAEVVSGADYAATILSGGSETVYGSATGDQIHGSVIVGGVGATVTSETVDVGGMLLIAGGAVDSASTVSAGGFETVLGSAIGDQIYGTQLVSDGTTAVSNETVADGGTLAIGAGGTANNTVLNGGGILVLGSPTAALTGTLIFSDGDNTLDVISLASSGDGDQAVISGFLPTDEIVISGVGASATLSFTTSNGNEYVTVSGGSGSETLIFSGTTTYTSSTLLLASAGAAVDLEYSSITSVTTSTVSGAYTETFHDTLLVLDGASVSAATIDNAAYLIVDGGADHGATILAGATETISAGSAAGDQIYGVATVDSGAAVTGETVQDGGTLAVDGGATASNTVVNGGGTIILESPTATLSGLLTFSDGYNTLVVAAIASSGDGDQAVISGFSSFDKIAVSGVGSGATLSFATSGGNTLVTVSGDSGAETFLFGGTAYNSNSLELVSSGGAVDLETSYANAGLVIQPYDPAEAGTIEAGPFALYAVPLTSGYIVPTQVNVGYQEVDDRAAGFDLYTSVAEVEDYLLTEIEPAVIGPNDELYILNGHHTITAVLESVWGTNPAVDFYIDIIANYSSDTEGQFWSTMEQEDLLFPLNDGVPETVNLSNGEINGSPYPTSFTALQDNAYRGLEYSILKEKDSKLFTTSSNITGVMGASTPGLDKINGFDSDFIWADAYQFANDGLGLPYLSPGDIAIATQWNLNPDSMTDIPGYGTISVAQLPGFILNADINITGQITSAMLTSGTLAGTETGTFSETGSASNFAAFDGYSSLNLGSGGQSIILGTPQNGAFVMQLGSDEGYSVTLSNVDNTYAGGTVFIAGTLVIAADGSLGAPAIYTTDSAFYSSPDWTLNAAGYPDNVTSAVEADNGIVWNSLSEGNGTLVIGTTSGGGTATFASDRAMAVGGETAIIDLDGYQVTWSGPILSLGQNQDGSGNQSGESNLTIDDTSTGSPGMFILPGSSNNEYFYGDWVIESGTLEVSSDASLGNTSGIADSIGEIDLDGGTLLIGASFDSVRSLFLTGNSIINTSGFNTTFNGSLSDDAQLLTIENTNTTTAGSATFGSFDVTDGTVLALSGGAAGETVTFTSGIVRGGNATLFIDPSTTSSLGNTEKLEVTSGATLIDNMAPAWIVVDNGGGASTNPYNFATYTSNGYVTADYTQVGSGSSAGLAVATSTDIVDETGSVTLTSAAQAYALKVNDGAVINGGQTITIGDGVDPAGLILDNATISGGVLAFNGSEAIIYVKGSSVSVSAVISGTNGMTLAGTGTLTLSTVAALTGTVNIDSGELSLTMANVFASDVGGLTLGAATDPTSATLNFTANQTFTTLNSLGTNGIITFSNGATLTIGDTTNNLTSIFSSDITETGAAAIGAITKAGSGLVDLSGIGSKDITLVSGSTVAVTDGVLRIIAKSFKNAPTITLSNNSELQFAENAGDVFAGTVSGAGDIRLIGGTLKVTGTFDTTNGTFVEDGSTLDITTSVFAGGNANIGDAGGLVVFDQTFSGTYSGVISNALQMGSGNLLTGTLIKDDSTGSNGGNVTLISAQTFTGDTYIEAGTLTLGGANILEDSAAVVLGRVGGGASATLVLDADNQLNSLSNNTSNTTSVTLNGYVLTLTPGAGSDSEFDGVIVDGSTPGGSLIISGGGAVTLSGANTFTGGVTLSAGTLELGNSNAAGSGAITFAGADPTLKIDFGDLPSNTISGFTYGDTIDLVGVGLFSSGSATVSGDTLTVVEGSSAYFLQVAPGLAGQVFALTSDGNGGVDITVELTSSVSISSGQTVSGVVVGNGGAITVSSGGTASDIVVNSGGTDVVGSGGIELGGQIAGGGTQLVEGGGRASGTVISSGGADVVGSGGTDFGAQVSGGGTQVTESGGTAVNFTIYSGGVLVISSGGYADPGVLSAGTEYISAGGTDNGTLISGGTQIDYGYASGDIIYAGSQVVESGGTAFATSVSGGELIVLSGGFADPAAIYSGGTLAIDGGTAFVQSGVNVSVPIDFVGSGSTLEIGGSGAVLSTYMSGLTISGLAAGDTIDLTNVTFSPGAAASLSSDVLDVTVGGSTYALQLISTFPREAFFVSGDGSTGTDITVRMLSATMSTISHGRHYSYSSITDVGDVILNGGTMFIESGGIASSTTVDKGGLLVIENGGLEVGLINSGSVNGSGGTLDGPVINSGIVEASGSGVALTIGGTVGNSKTIAALGTSATVEIVSATVTNTSIGVIEASGRAAQIVLDDAMIVSGKLEASGKNAAIEIVSANNELSAATITAGTPVEVNNGAALVLAATIDNAGTISATSATLEISGGVTLKGGGTIQLSTTGGNDIAGAGSGAALTNVNNTIAGAGTLGGSGLTLINSAGGVIDGNTTGGLTVSTTAVVTNLGVLEATTSGKLVIEATVSNAKTIEASGKSTQVEIVAATITNTSIGLIEASGLGAQVELDGTTIVSGKLKTSGKNAAIDIVSSSTVAISGATVVAGSVVDVTSGSTLVLAGTIDNAGTISATSATLLEISGPVTLKGGGTVELSSTGGDDIVGPGSGAALTNVNNTIAGAGTLGGSGLTLINSAGGVIDGNSSAAALTLVASTTNVGLLEGTTAEGLVVSGAVANARTIEASGKAALVEVVTATIINNSAGLIEASGSGAQVELDGATIVSGKLQTSGKNAAIAIAGNAPAAISGAALLAGSLIEVTGGATLTLDGGSIAAGAMVETLTSGTAILSGTVKNAGTLFASGSGSVIEIASGAVVNGGGGIAEVGNGIIEIAASGSSEAVTFLPTGSGGLVIGDTFDDAKDYTGNVTGFGGVHNSNTVQYIDLTSVSYSSNVSVTYSANAGNTGGVLTVTSGGSANVVAEISLVGNYKSAHFYASALPGGLAGSSGSVEIIDPAATITTGATLTLASTVNSPSVTTGTGNVALLGSYMASLFASVEGQVSTQLTTEPAQTQAALAHPHTG